MYELSPIICFDEPIEFPTCMYKQKNFHADEENGTLVKNSSICTNNFGTFKQVEQFLKNIESKEMAELEKRQEKLLNQIEELKKLMNDIKSQLKPINLPVKNSSTVSSCNIDRRMPVKLKDYSDIPDIVITVNPSYPPYFLIFLQELLKNEMCLKINCYLHSSVAKLPKDTEGLANKLKILCEPNGIPLLNVRLIWKEIGPNAELHVSHYPITGEANILRYLARNLNTLYENNFKLDALLDLSYRLSNTPSKTIRSNLLKTLNNSLSESKWLNGQNAPTIADVAVYDCLKKFVDSKEISGNLSKWLGQCEQYTK